jgi:hypothetical protein
MVSGALLQLRNTPDRESKLPPAKALYGREIRDCLPRPGSALMGAMWMNLVDARETAQASRAKNSEKKWSEYTRAQALAPLMVGHTVMDRDSNLTPAKALQWERAQRLFAGVCLVRLPEPWNYLLSFNIYSKKSLNVTQSPIVPRVRGGDPSGVATGKFEGFFSASGQPWNLIS